MKEQELKDKIANLEEQGKHRYMWTKESQFNYDKSLLIAQAELKGFQEGAKEKENFLIEFNKWIDKEISNFPSKEDNPWVVNRKEYKTLVMAKEIISRLQERA